MAPINVPMGTPRSGDKYLDFSDLIKILSKTNVGADLKCAIFTKCVGGGVIFVMFLVFRQKNLQKN